MKYKVKLNVSHNNKDYAPGDIIDMSEKAAKPLIEVGALEAPQKDKKDESKK